MDKKNISKYKQKMKKSMVENKSTDSLEMLQISSANCDCSSTFKTEHTDFKSEKVCENHNPKPSNVPIAKGSKKSSGIILKIFPKLCF